MIMIKNSKMLEENNNNSLEDSKRKSSLMKISLEDSKICGDDLIRK